jgi:hypothetical protein
MLLKAVAAVKTDKAKALDAFNGETAGFWIATSMYLCHCQRRQVRYDWQL